MSNLTLLLCSKAVNCVDPRRFPAGKARIETAGNICFCFLMTAVSFIIIASSIPDVVVGSETLLAPFHLLSMIAMAVAFATKICLCLYCFALRNQVSQIRILCVLWEDHRNNLLINGFGMLTSVLGSKIRWWINSDRCYCVANSGQWALAVLCAHGEFQILVGGLPIPRCSSSLLISTLHSPLIPAIYTGRAYKSGPRLLVELDKYMEDSASLHAIHGVAEAPQMKLESLPDVQYAEVHVDYQSIS